MCLDVSVEILGVPGGSWGFPGVLEGSGGCPGGSWRNLGHLWGHLGIATGSPRSPQGLLEGSERSLGCPRKRLSASQADIEIVQKPLVFWSICSRESRDQGPWASLIPSLFFEQIYIFLKLNLSKFESGLLKGVAPPLTEPQICPFLYIHN